VEAAKKDDNSSKEVKFENSGKVGKGGRIAFRGLVTFYPHWVSDLLGRWTQLI